MSASGIPKLLERHRYHMELLIHPDRGYPIEYDRMDTPEKVLGWIYHLCSKNWVTVDHIRQFIGEAERKGVEVNHNY